MRESIGSKGRVDYQVLRDNGRWPDHVARSYVTAGLLAWLKPDTVLDPACGDASIVRVAKRHWPFAAILGDISKANIEAARKVVPGDATYVVGDALSLIRSGRRVDVTVLTEFLEHMEDPVEILRSTADVSQRLIASSPIMRLGQRDMNPEHLWMFDRQGYEEMLLEGGWAPYQFTKLEFKTEYDFGIWVALKAGG